MTAWVALTGHRRVTAGDIVLTQGSGGVAVFALQFARVLGARVIATTSTAEKAERLKGTLSNSAADSLRRRPHARRNRSWTIIAFSFAGTLCGRLVDLNKSANSAIALCAS